MGREHARGDFLVLRIGPILPKVGVFKTPEGLGVVFKGRPRRGGHNFARLCKSDLLPMSSITECPTSLASRAPPSDKGALVEPNRRRRKRSLVGSYLESLEASKDRLNELCDQYRCVPLRLLDEIARPSDRDNNDQSSVVQADDLGSGEEAHEVRLRISAF
jgi:hypothetical protein